MGLEKDMDTLENAQKRAEYWKAESMAATREIESLRAQVAELADAFTVIWVSDDRSAWDGKAVEHFDALMAKVGAGDTEQTLDAIACLKALQKMEAPQLRKIHPLDFPIEVFLADLTTRPANIIRAELAVFASYAGTGTFDIEPPFTVRHLCMFSRSEMRKWPNFGRKCLNEVEEMLRARGLQLWENHDERSLRLLREHKEYFK